MHLVFLSLLLLCFSSLHSKQILLDQIMSKEDQKKTGVADLTPHQKTLLEAWINKNCNCEEKAAAQKEQLLFLSINVDDGEQIQLSDGSVWDISPDDYGTSAAWISPIPIVVGQSTDPNYPTLLTNKHTNASVKAKRGVLRPSSPYTPKSTPQTFTPPPPPPPPPKPKPRTPAPTYSPAPPIPPAPSAPKY